MSASAALMPVAQRLRAIPVSFWRALGMMLIALWVLWLLAKLVWRVDDAINWTPPAPKPIEERAISAKQVDIEALIQVELFGSAAEAVVEQSAQEAPDTTIPLKLLGVYAAETPLLASAIVAQNSGQQEVVFVGGDMPGGHGKLKEVFSDRVVIDRNGRLETLRMEDLTGQLAAMMQVQNDAVVKPAGEGTLDKRYDPQVSAAIQDFREKLNTDPASLTDIMRVEPAYVNGEMQGYRIGPGKDRKLFARFGLQANDLVTAINGVRMDDPTRAFTMMNDINSAKELNITLRRGEQEVNLLLNMQANDSQNLR